MQRSCHPNVLCCGLAALVLSGAAFAQPLSTVTARSASPSGIGAFSMPRMSPLPAATFNAPSNGASSDRPPLTIEPPSPDNGQRLIVDVNTKPVVFAKNRLEIAVEKGNPKKVSGLADLAKSGLIVVLCADAVPCGKYAVQAFANAGVRVSPASKEENAKATLSKVSLGEADASVVYVTDVKAAKGEVSGVKIPDRQNVIANYPIAVTNDGRSSAAAKAWVQFIQSKAAQTTLRKFGFLPP